MFELELSRHFLFRIRDCHSKAGLASACLSLNEPLKSRSYQIQPCSSVEMGERQSQSVVGNIKAGTKESKIGASVLVPNCTLHLAKSTRTMATYRTRDPS